MAAMTSESSVISGDMQEQMDELQSMFPELSIAEMRNLINHYRGDLPTIVDKLLQQPSPPSSTAMETQQSTKTNSVSTTEKTPHTGQTMHYTPISSPEKHSMNGVASTPPSYTPANSPWGPKSDSPAASAKGFPTAFASRDSVEPSAPPATLIESYSASTPLVATRHPTLTQATNPTTTENEKSSPTPLRIPIESKVTQNGESAPIAVTTVFSTEPLATAPMQSPSESFEQLLITPPSFTTPMPPHYDSVQNETMSHPIETQLSSELQEPLNTTPKNAHMTRQLPPSPPTSHIEPSLIHSTSSNGSLSRVTTGLSPLTSSSLTTSRLTDERLARLRAAEQQFQLLMASMSEMEANGVRELEEKEARIQNLEAELTQERASNLERLQTLSQANMQLREQLAQQSSLVDKLESELKARDEEMAALKAKLASYKPIEAAEQFRAQLEANLRETNKTHTGEVQVAMELFSSVFQRALAASLLQPAPSNS